MALNIKSAEAHRLARELAARTGESLPEAVTEGIRHRLSLLEPVGQGDLLEAEVAAIQAFVASLPDRDTRSPEEILGFDEHGLPG